MAGGFSPSVLAVAKVAAAASRQVDGVVELDAGPLGSFSTYGDGRRCEGVTVASSDAGHLVSIRLVARFGTLLPELGSEVRDAVLHELEPLLGPEPVSVDVAITDLSAAPA